LIPTRCWKASPTQNSQFAAEAAALDVGDVRDISHRENGTHCCLLSCVRHACRCRDELVEMLLRRVRKTQALAKEQLEPCMISTWIEEPDRGFSQVLTTEQTQDADDVFGAR